MLSVEPDVESGVKNLNINDKTDVNILLLGETGVGKSTMINSLANYLTYKDFDVAKREELLVLIPTEFIATDKNNEFQIIKVGERDEQVEPGVSSTQSIKTYVFPIWNGNAKLRLIDTPGMKSTKGTNQDHINSENILRYIGQLNVLHAIFFVLNPNQPSNVEVFRYCLSCILSQLDKSASKNIIFVFTNTRGTEYGPGDTINFLKNEIDVVRNSQPELDIPINRNIFCFDNEPFRYLAAIKKNIEFDEMIEERNSESWKNSLEQCWKLINYIVGGSKIQPLKPHHIKSASAINEARRMINQLMLPLIDISQLIFDNVNALERHEAYMRLDNQSLEQLRSKMYIPIISLDIMERKHPITICTARKCAELYMVGGNNKWLYKACQDPCHLTYSPKELIGVPAMESSNCTICGCDFKIHMHVYYLMKVKEERELDSVVENATSSEELVEKMKQILKNINIKKEELDAELKFIITACSKFALFLQYNVITSFNDNFKEFLEYLINREKALGKTCDKETVKNLEKFLREYEETKSSFEEVLRLNQKIGRTDLTVTPKDINETTQQLYKLKHNGRKIKQLYVCQKKARANEHAHSEKVQKIEFKTDEDKGAKKKQEPKKNNDEKGTKKEENVVNKEKAMKNKSDIKKEKDPKDCSDKGKNKEKGDDEKGSKEKNEKKNNIKKEKDRNGAENKKKIDPDKKEKAKKEQGGKANNKEKSDDNKERDNKNDKGKEKGDDEKGNKEKSDTKYNKKEKDKNGAENKNKKENDPDKKEKDKEQGGKASNKKEKGEDNKDRDKKNDMQKDDKKRKVNEKKDKDKKSSDKNEQVSGNRNRQPIQGTMSRNDEDAPPSYYEIHQRHSQPIHPSQGPSPHVRPGYHPPPYGGYNHEPLGRTQGPPPHSGPYGPPHHVEAYGSTHPVGAYGPPTPASPYYPSPGAEPYRYDHDYRHSSEPPQDNRPTYNISIKLDKQEDVSKTRSLRDPYHPPPYVAPPAVQGVQYYPTLPPGTHGGPPASYSYGSAPYDHHHGVPHHSISNATTHANSSRQGNDRSRGGQRGKGRGRGGINKKTSGKKVNKKSEGKDKDSESDDSD